MISKTREMNQILSLSIIFIYKYILIHQMHCKFKWILSRSFFLGEISVTFIIHVIHKLKCGCSESVKS